MIADSNEIGRFSKKEKEGKMRRRERKAEDKTRVAIYEITSSKQDSLSVCLSTPSMGVQELEGDYFKT